MEGEYTELGQYLLALLESQNLSMRQGSIRSGLEAGTISKILRRDGRSVPTPETLEKLAQGLKGDFIRMMRLAQHLPPETDGDDPMEDPEFYHMAREFLHLLWEVRKKDRAAAERLAGMFQITLGVMLELERPGLAVGDTQSQAEVATDVEGVLPGAEPSMGAA